MSHPQLSTGALASIMQGNPVDEPILQIIGSKRLDSSSGKPRHRILLSDGVYKVSHAMYTISPNDTLVVNGEIPEYTIVKIMRYITSKVGKESEKKVMVVLDIEKIKDGKLVGHIIGSPEALTVDTPISNSSNTSDNSNKTTSSYNNGNHAQASSEYEPAPKKPAMAATNEYESKKPAMAATNEYESKKPMLSGPPPSLDDSSSSFSTELIMPITSLTPYQNKWVIKARVTSKSPIRTWSNSKGEGKLFNFELLDKSGEIRVTGFRDMVDKFYEYIEVEKVYYVSKCQIKMANKQFSSLKNDYEMTLSGESIIQECQDSAENMPTVQYNFVSFDQLANKEVNSVIDVIGVCKSAGDLQTLIARSTSKELKKRDVVLVDQTKVAITLTLWGNEAEQFEANSQIIAVKGARIHTFGGGMTLTISQNSTFKTNPDLKEAFALRGWYDNGGNREETSNLSARTGSGGAADWVSFKNVQLDKLGSSDRGDIYQNVGTVLLVRNDRMMYKACASAQCNKKVLDQENGKYRCEKCNTETSDFKYRLLGNFNVGDWSGNQWVTIFNPECEIMFGSTAPEIGDKVANNPNYMQHLIAETNFKEFVFKCRVKTETYNDDSRLQTSVLKVEPINYKAYNAHLISQIQQFAE